MMGNKKSVRRKFHRVFAGLMAGVCIVTSLYIAPAQKSYAETEYSLEQYEEKKDDYSTVIGYREYMEQVKQTRPADVYVIDAADYVRLDGMTVKTYENYEGMEGTSVYTENSGLIEYEVFIKNAGLYEMSVCYYPVAGNSSSIQRSFFIDGKLPFAEFNCIEFSRVWGNESEVWKKDNQGNDLREKQVEKPEWIQSYLYESEGYVSGKLSVYLTEGLHTITIMSVREPMMLPTDLVAL